MRPQITQFQVHRFRDMVAIYLAGKDSSENPFSSPTVYLSADVANLLAEALIAAKHDINIFPKFSESQFETTTFGTDD